MAKEKKHEQKIDLLIKISRRVEQFLTTYLKIILLTIGVAVVLLAAYFSVNSIVSRKETLAESAFGKVYMAYRDITGDENLQENELREKLLGLTVSFKVILEEHPKTKAASKSAYYLGNIYYTAREYERALEYFKKGHEIPKQRHYAALLCYLGEATTYEQLGNYEKSEEIYNFVLDKYKTSYIVPTVRFNLGQLYEKMDKIEAARDQYNIIVTSYEWSSWSDFAEKRILLLKNKSS